MEPDEEPLPPLPTRVRLDARLRDAPRQRTDVTLAIFLALLAFLGFSGYKGFAAIGDFIRLTQRSLEMRRHATPSPEPVQVEFR